MVGAEPIPMPARQAIAGWLYFGVLAGCIFATGRLCMAIPRDAGTLAPIWVSNAIALAMLLRSGPNPRRWILTILACAAGNIAARMAVAPVLAPTLSLWGANALEYTAAACLLMPAYRRSGGLETTRDILRLGGVAALVSVVSGVVAASCLWMFGRENFEASLRSWIPAHVFSLLLLTPCILAFSRFREHLRDHPLTIRAALSLLLLLAVAIFVFSQTRCPLLFLLPPALLVVSLEFGVFGASIGVLLTGAIAAWATLMHVGPIAMTRGNVLDQTAVLQLFLTVLLISSLPIAQMQARQRRLQTLTSREADRGARAEAVALQSEARYRLLAEHARDAIITVGNTGAFTFASPAVFSLTGYREDELCGRFVSDFVDPEDFSTMDTVFRDLVMGTREPGAPIEYRFRRKDGSWVWLQVNPQVVREANGQVSGFVDVARDITDRKALEAELRAARAEAEAAAQVKSQFLANMSHELRTPLTAVIGFANLLGERRELSDQSKVYVDRVRTAGKALLCTVNDILDFSKLEAGQVEIKLGPSQPRELGSEVLSMFEAQVESRGIALRLHVDDEVPSIVSLDEDRVRHILINLVGNAVKFTQQGEVALRLAYAGERLNLAVADTGLGIPAAKIGTLFQRFSQVDNSNTRQHGGTGLGLAICKSLAEAMGGVIRVTSEEGVGSIFSVELPALAQADAACEDVAQAAPTFEGRHRVLLAEDNSANRELVKAMLAPFDIDIEAVEDGLKAVEAAAAMAFDLILMDLHMPHMGGRDAARAIRASVGPNARKPIIAFSADVLQYDDDIFTGTMAKPILVSELFEVLDQHLNPPDLDAIGEDQPMASYG